MKDTIDWDATYEEGGGTDPKHFESLHEACDHWRSLAYQEHERAERLEWMLDHNLALGSAYPKVMKEKLEDEYARRDQPTSSPPPRAWPFR